MDFFGKIVQSFSRQLKVAIDLAGLFYKTLLSTKNMFNKNKWSIFSTLFLRQVYSTGIKAVYVNAVIGFLTGLLAMLIAKSLLKENTMLIDYYAKFYVMVIVRELGPLISGIILIARSANAVTAEIGYLKQHNQISVLEAFKVCPIFLISLPIFFAFPVSLILMFFYFNLFFLVSSWGIMSFLQGDAVSFSALTMSVVQIISFQDVLISIAKAVIGGAIIGLACVYYGSSVEAKFSSISWSISASTTTQLTLFFAVNILLSMQVYI